MGQARLTNTNHYKDWPETLKAVAERAVIGNNQDWKPILVDMASPSGARRLDELMQGLPVTSIIDNLDEQLAELFISQHAQLYKANAEVKASSIADHLKSYYGSKPAWQKGTWVYYPWNGQLVHVVEAELFWELRTIRNKDLITAEEQAAYTDFRVGCAGMSVGSSGATAIVLMSGSRQLKLSDGAVFSGSNLNRVRAGISGIGMNKCIITARQLYEMNPYIELYIQPTNITKANVDSFFTEPWALNAVVDEIDSLDVKVLLRVEARKRRLPVVMVTEPGDGIILDVERFDLDPNLPLFHGLAGRIEDILEKDKFSQREFTKYAMKIIGIKNLPLRDQKSMLKVGAQLPSPPQLGGTAMLAGSAISYALRQLATGGKIKSGRHHLSLEKAFLEGATVPAIVGTTSSTRV